MGVKWGARLAVGVVSPAGGAARGVRDSFALVGLSARQRAAVGGPDDGAPAGLSAGAGTAIAGLCLLAAAAIVGYGLYIIIA